MSSGQRIKEAREDLRISQPELAKRARVTKSAVSQWENGSTKELKADHLLAVAKALNVSPDWLATGRGPKQRTQDIDQGSEPKVSLIPLLTWAQVRDWHETAGASHTSGIMDRVAVVGTFGPRTFALHVCGDSMEPAFFEGDTIIVDPDREPKGRDYVIVIGKPTSEPTFKQLLVEVDERYLKPANRRYHILPVTADMVIVGVVVMKMRVY
jgi:SOS-response transcriptional repressor LexA